MAESQANQTIAGSYRVVEIDGEEVVLHRVGDKWVTTQDRLDREHDAEFMARFADTETRPGTAHTIQDPNVERKPSQSQISLNRTRANIEAYLVEQLGDPRLILDRQPDAWVRLQRFKHNEALLRPALGLIKLLPEHELWGQVGALLTDAGPHG